MSEETPGFRQDKEPTKKQLKAKLMQMKALNAQLTEHLQFMGPTMERLMRGAWSVLGLCHRKKKELDLMISIPAKQTEELKDMLVKACEHVAEGAVEYRRMHNPNFDAEAFAANIDMGLDHEDEVDAEGAEIKPEIKCKKCDWEGTWKEAMRPEEGNEGLPICPICKSEIGEVFNGPKEA